MMFNDDLAVMQQIFAGLPERDLLELYRTARVAQYAPGTRLCTEGQSGDTFFILVRGRVDVVRSLEGEEVPIDCLIEGNCFGEIGFILNSPRTADVVVAEPARVIEIDQESFRRHILAHPETVMALSRLVLQRLLKQQDVLLTHIAIHRRQSTPPQIFLSYSRQDRVFVDRLFHQLTRHHIRAWLDHRHITYGMDWAREVCEALDACGVMILVLSPASVASDQVTREWATFLEMGKPVVPIRLRPCTIPAALDRFQYVDFVTQDFDVAMCRLIAQLSLFDVSMLRERIGGQAERHWE